ncbi:putative bifunctional diguanylate cyclase/phosphodiesterase [Zavarzinia sp. CC-PAN008]|uniref:putative bifunctional diguanylate cyclase/phosphodiesterase n=1 Tax=Zavarzinia sp. CC-PAN008 TaxID=3243332 RepID=UPI003F74226E
MTMLLPDGRAMPGLHPTLMRLATRAAALHRTLQAPRGLLMIVAPFVAIILMQAFFAAFSLSLLSAARAYVAGESQWTKASNSAIYSLARYVDTQDEHYLASFHENMSVPRGDRLARLEIERDDTDHAAAHAGFIAGRNDPADVPLLIWLLETFSGVPMLDDAVVFWRRTDAVIAEVEATARAIEREVDRGTMSGPRVTYWKARVDAVGQRLSPLASAFSEALGAASRQIQNILTAINLFMAALLITLTVWRVRRFLEHRQNVEGELSWQAAHDTLTGLANRRSFEAQVRAALSRIAPGGPGHALAFVDLDQFKIVNDTCGHKAGDALLRRIAATLASHLRGVDLLARLGGDEFGVLLRDCPASQMTEIMERLRVAVQDLGFVWDGRAFATGASIGLVHVDEASVTLEEAMSFADLACYMSKEKGRNRIHVHKHDDAALRQRSGEMNWAQRIHEALEGDLFFLEAQEIVPLGTADAHGQHIELLVRLRDGHGGTVPPAAFIPAAERFGLMPAIDRWVIRTAFATLSRRLTRQGASPIATCAINLSGVTIGDETFLQFLEAQFAQHPVPPSMICFEITETSAISNMDDAAHFIAALRAMGCRFALDDFGVGMCSFSYLKRLPVDYLKIDGSFIRDVMTDPQDRAIVAMMAGIGRVMGKQTIAEFVECAEMAEELRQMGVDFVQGFGVARPFTFDAGSSLPLRPLLQAA